MKSLFLMLCVSCISTYAQSLLPKPHFSQRRYTISYYELSHQPSRHARRLMDEALQKMRHLDYSGAVASLRSALAIDRDCFEAHLNLGAAYYWQGNRPAASREFESAVSLDPYNPLGLVNLSVCRLKEGRLDSALSLARRALRLDPESNLARSILQSQSGAGK